MTVARNWISWGALAVAAVLVGWWGVNQQRFSREQSATVARLEAANHSLQERTTQLERESASLREQLVASGMEPVKPATNVHPNPATDDSAARLESVRMLTQVQAKLSAANSAIADLRNRQQELEGTIDRMTAENKRLVTEGSELRESLTSTKSLVQALEGEMKTKSDRITQLEAAAKRFRDDTQGANQRVAEFAKAARELEDLNRRRENYMSSLQRRYRDLTDQYRALAVRMETQRDNPVAFAPDVSRIQSTVQLAEDDLRQITSLNTQAQRVTEKLANR